MKFGIIGNTGKPVVKEVAESLISFLMKKNIPFVLHKELAKLFRKGDALPGKVKLITYSADFSKECDIVIALGGDGTMLTVARYVGKYQIPILGINVGKLGFLAEVSVDEMQQCINEIIAGKYSVEERMVLEAKALSDGKKYYGLNEVVIDKGASARIVSLETYVNNDYLVTYSADGIMLTTPTGSTGYSLATGGPLVAPQSNVIVINPMAPHTLTARPVIVPDTSVIKVIVKAAAKSAHIAADGQVEGFYEIPAEFEIRKANYNIKLVKRKQRTFYDLLRTKLMWGRDLRTGKS